MKSSIILSIFKRKGGEGVLTKLIEENNRLVYCSQEVQLSSEEEALIVFNQDEASWLLLTNNRIIEKKEGIVISIYYSDLIEVTPAIQKEFKNRIIDKQDFTLLSLKDKNNKNYVLRVEKGKPYQGIYQVLHHIISINK